MISLRMPHSVEIHRPTQVTDEYGDATESWDSPTKTKLPAFVQPSSTGTEDQTGDRHRATSTFSIYLQPGVDVRPKDRVLWNGLFFEVEGVPFTWNTGMSANGYTQATLVRVEDL